ncbi:hypothetical protein MRX96_013085 [Rhipicephalus microplus]
MRDYRGQEQCVTAMYKQGLLQPPKTRRASRHLRRGGSALISCAGGIRHQAEWRTRCGNGQEAESRTPWDARTCHPGFCCCYFICDAITPRLSEASCVARLCSTHAREQTRR